ncbi:trypsin-like serine protease [Altererythrobacter salegens]|uniref:Trypsin-like serine protease n=2 Tax=Croceibacterium salegens TaxID=1737568 RepID=A0A6I4SRS3_9SPHN|nr:trypsin-like serine protease [Croceibacterium salegens]
MVLLALPAALQADPADIDAAARGVVRVVIVESGGDGDLLPLGHGTGFAVTPEYIVTNAHVVTEARNDPNLSIGIVPSDGGEAVYGRIVSVSQRNDLALIATTKAMNLPPLTISGNPPADSGQVISVGYPMNVDRAQGLKVGDLFRSQPPVKATGALAGHRPTREFDTLLHTAPIARGNSGGPLLDPCGRVVGVNSFGAESAGADGEFYFAISTRELLPFLRANNVTPQINSTPCRSLADLDADERARAEEDARQAQAKAQAAEEALVQRREEARRTIDFEIIDERDNRMALTLLLVLVAMGAGGFAYLRYEDEDRQQMKIAGGVAALAVFAALAAWFSRPTFSEGDDRLQDLLREEMSAEDTGAIAGSGLQPGKLTCTLQPARSRVTGTAAQTVPIEWTAEGCINGRTQYGADAGAWSRVLVPNDEASVSVARFDPSIGEYRVERYLLGHDEMTKARTARSEYEAPACGGGAEAARDLGAKQAAILSLLPSQPNERLVYACSLATE